LGAHNFFNHCLLPTNKTQCRQVASSAGELRKHDRRRKTGPTITRGDGPIFLKVMHDCSSLGPFCAVAITIGVSAGGRLLGCCCNEACLLHWFLLVWIKLSEECPAGPRRKGRKSKLCPSGKIQSLSFQMSEARVLDTEGKLAGSFSSDS
jgi:hypothetical protein